MAEGEGPLAAWRRDESLRPMEERLAASTRPRVVSFDFFDTLILRLCAEPADLFAEVGRQLAGAGLLRTPLPPAQFRSIRMMAEEKAREVIARSGRCPEVKLAEIYAELRDVVTDPAAARDLEFRIERSVCFLNPAMASLVEHVRALGCRTAIVSDTYFTATELRQLLADQDMPDRFDAIFVSCERGKAKWWNGTLYQDLLKQFDIHPGEALHIGDNLGTDVRRGRRIGLDTLHYYRTNPSLGAAFAGEQKLAGYGERRTGSLETLRVLAYRQAEAKEDAFRDGALTLGPVLARFADWCVEQYARAGVRRVLSLMREGELLGELVRRSAVAAGVDLEIVTCFASRMSTARAAMSTVSVESAAALLEGSQQLAPQGILEILGLAQEGAQFLSAETREKPFPSPEAAVQFLNALFGLQSLRRQIEARQRESFELAFEYLSSLIGDATDVGVLDLGWSGSIQRNIARIMRLGGRPVRTVGRYLACTKRAGRLALEGHEALAYLDSNWNRSAILPEVCITACVGSTTGYARDAGGRVVPVLDADAPSGEQVAIKGRVRAGVLAFQELWLGVRRRQEALGLPPELLADMDRLSPSILYRWMDFPTKPEADRLGSLYHDENYFGRINSAPLCNEESRRRFRRDGAQALFFDSRCYWPQGVMAQVYPRVVGLVGRGWDDPLAVGRLGAWNGMAEADAGLTGDELVSLRELLTILKAGQVIFFGSFAPSLISLLNGNAHGPIVTAEGSYPRLIVAGPDASDLGSGAETGGTCRVVESDRQIVATIAAVRELLCPDVDVALVLSGDVPALEVSPILQGLAPFLGKRGSILGACGRFQYASVEYDPSSDPFLQNGYYHPMNESPIMSSLRDWCRTAADDLGFGIWKGESRATVNLSNWIVLLHSPEERPWTGQWMGIPEDVDLRHEQPAAAASEVA